MLFDEQDYLQNPPLFSQMPDRSWTTGANYQRRMGYPTPQGNGVITQPGPYARGYPTGKPQYTGLDETLGEYDKTRPEPMIQAEGPPSVHAYPSGIQFSDAATGVDLMQNRYARPDEVKQSFNQGDPTAFNPQSAAQFKPAEPTYDTPQAENPAYLPWLQKRNEITEPYLANRGRSTDDQMMIDENRANLRSDVESKKMDAMKHKAAMDYVTKNGTRLLMGDTTADDLYNEYMGGGPKPATVTSGDAFTNAPMSDKGKQIEMSVGPKGQINVSPADKQLLDAAKAKGDKATIQKILAKYKGA